MNPPYELTPIEGVPVIKVNNLLSEYVVKETLDAVSREMLSGQYHYVVDLSDIDYMNSVGLNFLLILKSRAGLMGGRIGIASPSPKVIQLLKMTKLLDILNPTDTLEAALAQVKGG